MTHRLIKIIVSIILLLAVAIPNGWTSPAQAQTTALFFARGRVTDNRGNPIANTAVHALPAGANGSVFMTNAAGQWQSQHAATASQVFKTGLQSTVQTQINQDRSLHIVVSPVANQMVNGDFESDLGGWTTGGTGMARVEANGHSGKAARLGAYCPPPCLAENENIVPESTLGYSFNVDSQENNHFISSEGEYWMRTAGGHLLRPDQPFGVDIPYYAEVEAEIDSNDVLHAIFSSHKYIVYSQKSPNESWTNFEVIYTLTDQTNRPYEIWMDVDQLGQAHVVYKIDTYNVTLYKYTRRDVDGNWSPSVEFTDSLTEIAGAAGGGAYLFFADTMRRALPDGTLQKRVSTGGCMVVDARLTNQGEVQVLCYGWPSEYRVMNSKGEWQMRHTFKTDPYIAVNGYFSRDGSAIFWTGELSDKGIDTYWLKLPDANELQYFTHFSGNYFAYDFQSPYLTRYGGLHLLHSDTTYAQSRVDLQTTEATLEQTVTVPPLSENPTLSFFYQIQGPAKLKESGFTLTLVDEGGTATNLRTDRVVGLWKHGWVDLARWAGQTVTLRFRYKQAAGEPLATLLVDEVSLGAWETPVIRAIDPGDVVDWISAPVTVTLNGGYFLEGAVVELKGQSIPATVVSQGELTFAVPGDLPPGHYNIRVTNPGGKQSNFIVLRLGLQHLLPFVGG